MGDKNTANEILKLVPGVKKGLIIKSPFIFLRKGLVSIGAIVGYGSANTRIYRPPFIKNTVLKTEDCINQKPKLYVNPEDPEDVIVVTQDAIDALKKGIDLSVKERKAQAQM